jgi:hypothetical protein
MPCPVEWLTSQGSPNDEEDNFGADIGAVNGLHAACIFLDASHVSLPQGERSTPYNM